MKDFNLKHIARLARLYFSDAELRQFESQVADILSFVEELKKVDVSKVEPTSHPFFLSNVFRDDKIEPSLSIESFLKKSPKSKGRFFEVPKIIEDKN